MAHAYSEDQLVEQPAIQLFAEMGWPTVLDLDEASGIGGMIGNETKGQRGWAELLTPFHCCSRGCCQDRQH